MLKNILKVKMSFHVSNQFFSMLAIKMHFKCHWEKSFCGYQILNFVQIFRDFMFLKAKAYRERNCTYKNESFS